MAGDLQFGEQVSALVTASTRARLDAISVARRAAGVPWPDRSLGAVVRDAIDAGLAEIDDEPALDEDLTDRIAAGRARPERRVTRPGRRATGKD
jgi:hypothetical protein